MAPTPLQSVNEEILALERQIIALCNLLEAQRLQPTQPAHSSSVMEGRLQETLVTILRESDAARRQRWNLLVTLQITPPVLDQTEPPAVRDDRGKLIGH